jgi:hypothetical protein
MGLDEGHRRTCLTRAFIPVGTINIFEVESDRGWIEERARNHEPCNQEHVAKQKYLGQNQIEN